MKTIRVWIMILYQHFPFLTSLLCSQLFSKHNENPRQFCQWTSNFQHYQKWKLFFLSEFRHVFFFAWLIINNIFFSIFLSMLSFSLSLISLSSHPLLESCFRFPFLWFLSFLIIFSGKYSGVFSVFILFDFF